MFNTKYRHDLKAVSTVIDSLGVMTLSLISMENAYDAERPGAFHQLVVNDGDNVVELSTYSSTYSGFYGDDLSALLMAHANELTHKASLWKESGILKGWLEQ